MSKPIDTAFLDELKAESDYIAATSTRFTKLTLEQGDEATIRLLPIKLAGNRFYGKTAKHWVNKTAIVCPRKTDAAYGGDPEADCAVCDFCEENRNHSDTQVADRAYDSISKPGYTMFVRVINSTARSFRKESKDTAHEFNTWGSTMDDLLAIYRRQAGKGILLEDPVDGYDLFVRRTKRGTLIELDEQGELYTSDAGGKRLKAILSTVNFKKPTMPDNADLRKFAEKVEDYCFSGSEKGGSGGRGRGRSDDDDAPRGRSSRRDDTDTSHTDDEAPRRSSRRDDADNTDSAPARSRRDNDSEDSDRNHADREPRRSRNDSDDDEIPGLPTPPPNRAVSSPPARRSAAPSSVREQAEEPEPRRGGHRHDDPEEDDTTAEEQRDAVPPRPPADEESPSEDPVPPPRAPTRLAERLSKTIRP